MKSYSITPFEFTCADGTTFKGSGNGYPLGWRIINGTD